MSIADLEQGLARFEDALFNQGSSLSGSTLSDMEQTMSMMAMYLGEKLGDSKANELLLRIDKCFDRIDSLK